MSRYSVLMAKQRHPIPIVPTTLNVANWIFRLAYLENIHVQPMKLHRLLYLTQAHFAALNGGRAFMPAQFVATKKGPIEPNLYQIMVDGLPKLDPPPKAPSDDAIAFMEVVWRKYGHHRADHLLKVISRDEAFFRTMQAYPGGVIPLEMITKEYLSGVESGKIEMPKRYTQKGKVMTSWSIDKTADPRKVINGPEQQVPKRERTVAEELALEIARGGVAEKAKFLDLNTQNQGFQAISAHFNQPSESRPVPDRSTKVSQLADELIAKNKPIVTIEDEANAEEVALRILSAIGDTGDARGKAPVKMATGRWKPNQAPKNARVLRSSGDVNSAPNGGLPWRKK